MSWFRFETGESQLMFRYRTSPVSGGWSNSSVLLLAAALCGQPLNLVPGPRGPTAVGESYSSPHQICFYGSPPGSQPVLRQLFHPAQTTGGETILQDSTGFTYPGMVPCLIRVVNDFLHLSAPFLNPESPLFRVKKDRLPLDGWWLLSTLIPIRAS